MYGNRHIGTQTSTALLETEKMLIKGYIFSIRSQTFCRAAASCGQQVSCPFIDVTRRKIVIAV